MQRLFLLLALIPAMAYSRTEIKVALSSMPSNLNPFYSTDANSQNINRLVYRSLLDFDREMRPFCDACSKFNNVVSNDGKQKVYFKLRDDLSFHDGSPLSAVDVENSLKYFQSKEIGSVFQSVFSKIIKINIISKFEIEFFYDRFDYDNLGNLSLLRIFKLKEGYQKDFDPKYFIGSGDYWYNIFEPNSISVDSLDKQGKSFLFKVVRDETTAALKLMNDEVDISIANMSPRKIKWLKSNAKENLDLSISEGSNYVYLNINHENKLLKKHKVRQAIASSIPLNDIIDYRLNGFVERANSIFAPSFKRYYSPVKALNYDLSTAEKLLTEIGAEKKDGVFYFEGKPIEFDLLISSNKNTFETAKIIENELSRSGIKINLVMLEWGTFMRRYKAGQFDLVLGQWVGFTGPGILNYIFHSDSLPPNGGNRGRYKNQAFEDYYARSLITGNEEERSQLIKSAVETVFKDVAYISLWHPKVIWIKKKCITKLRPFSNGSFLALKEAKSLCQK